MEEEARIIEAQKCWDQQVEMQDIQDNNQTEYMEEEGSASRNAGHT